MTIDPKGNMHYINIRWIIIKRESSEDDVYFSKKKKELV